MTFDIRARQFGTLFSEGIETGETESPGERRRRRDQTLRESATGAFLRTVTNIIWLGLRTRWNPGGVLARRYASAGADPVTLNPQRALAAPDGLVAFADRLTPETMIDGYTRGMFLRWIAGRPSWWSPQVHMAMHPADGPAADRLGALVRLHGFRITIDREFENVVAAVTDANGLAGGAFFPNTAGMSSFCDLYDAGFAHSVEVRNTAGVLIGGVYGVATGRVFFTQGAFGKTRDAADAAMLALNRHLAEWGFVLHNACDLHLAGTELESLGFAPQARKDMLERLTHSLSDSRLGRWLAIPALCAEQGIDWREAA